MENVIIDTREPKKIQELAYNIIGAKPDYLPVGDLTNGTIGIERKTPTDFKQSLVSGRLHAQAIELRENYEKGFIIIVGENSHYSLSMKNFFGAIASLMIRDGVYCYTVKNLIEYFCLCGRLFAKTETTRKTDYRKVKRIHSNPKMNVLCAIEGIGAKKAAQILEYCNEDLWKIKKMEESELLEIGLNRTDVKKVKEIFG
jgi:ERCC4-type nuclease